MKFILLFLTLTTLVHARDRYQRPELDLPSDWKQGASNQKPALTDEWWKAFQSSELNDLVVQALNANQDLAAAQGRVNSARALLGMRRADWFPTLALTGGVGTTRLSESAFGANLPPQFGDVSSLVQRDQFRLGVEVSYEIDLWGRIRRGIESAEAKARASEEVIAAHRLIVAAEVCRSFFLLRSLDWQSQILRDTLKVRGEALELQRNREEGGLGDAMEVNRARTEHELAKADLAVTQAQRGKVENALAVLCGRPSSSFRVAEQSSLPRTPSVPAGMPADILQARPDLRAAEHALMASHADIAAAKAAFYPTFRLTGNAGLESIERRGFSDWENRTYSIGPSFSLPLFTGGKLKAQLKHARAEQEQAVANYKQTLLTAVKDVEDALVDLQSLTTQQKALQAAQAAASDTAKLVRLRQEKGLASYFEVVEADRTALGTQLRLAQIKGQRGVSTVMLIQALGGGWQK